MHEKAAALILTLCFILVFSGCEKDNAYQIKITIPAGSTDWFVYSDEDISPTGNKITISAGYGMEETEVILKTVEVREETAYLPETLAPDKPVIMDVEKGAWFKVGVSLQNETETDQTFYVIVENVKVRTE